MNLRKVRRDLWSRCSGRPPEPEKKVLTSAFLLRRILLLPTVALLVLGLAGTAYMTAHRRTDHLYDRLLPAVHNLDAAATALNKAHREALRRLQPTPDGGDGTDLVGLGDTYRMRLAEAEQRLNQAAQTGALDRGQEQELRVVSGLVAGYDTNIAWAHTHRGEPQLHHTGLHYATEMLCHDYDQKFLCQPLEDGKGPRTAARERIRGLQAELRAEAHDSSSWWGVLPLGLGAVAASALFCLLTFGTRAFLRKELHLGGSALTTAALVMVGVVLLLGTGAGVEFSAQRKAAAKTAHERPRNTAAPTSTDGLELAAAAVLAVGAAGALGCGLVLRHHGRDYFDLKDVRA